MKLIAAITGVVAIAGAIACGNPDTPPAATDNEPAARPTIAALIPIVTPANTLTLITPTLGNTPATSSKQSNPATPPATAASPSPAAANATARPTAVKPSNAGGLVMTAKSPLPRPLLPLRPRPQLPARR